MMEAATDDEDEGDEGVDGVEDAIMRRIGAHEYMDNMWYCQTRGGQEEGEGCEMIG